MKKTKIILMFLTAFSAALSCKKKDIEIKSTSYNYHADGLIKQIFSDKYFDCSYIVKPQPDENFLELMEIIMPAADYKTRLIKILNLKNESTVDSLVELSKRFDFQNSMFRNKTKLIEQREFDSIKTILDSVVKFGTEKEIDSLFDDCPYNFHFISKPVFDKTYQIAVIDIAGGLTCLRRHPDIYKLTNGKWERIEH